MSARREAMSASRRTALRWTGYIALAVVFAIVCVFLSQWQIARSEERQSLLDLVARNYDAAPAPLDSLLSPDGEFPSDSEWHPVTVSGSYLIDRQLLVRNRPRGGTAAFEVLVPFKTDDGRILIVDRGWVPPGDDALPDRVPEPAAGRITVTVRLRPSEPERSSSRGIVDGQIATIYLPLIASSTGPTTITQAYGLLASETPASEALGTIEPPAVDPGINISYAVQWILFAVMGFVFIGYVIRTEIRNAREDGPRRKKKVRDRDAAEEDALLDG